MTRNGLRWSRLLCLGALAGWMGVAAAPAKAAPAAVQPAAAAPSAEDVSMAKTLHEQLARVFFLPKELKIDPALRTAADALKSAHLARMKTQLALWVQEERAVQLAADGKPNPNIVFHAAMARMLNELAYWHLDPGDAAYEAATLEVLRTAPQVCLTGADPRFTDFSSRILRIQAMPAARQQAALASEAQLLERWGKPRPAPLPWPEVLPQDAAMEAVRQIQSGGKRPAGALSAALAWRLLAARDAYDALPVETRCALKQWWLQESLRQGQAPAAALNAFRYATLVTATLRFGNAFEPVPGSDAPPPAAGKPAYPKLAARFDVTGLTTVSRRFDAAGKPEQAAVVGRKITVRGIRGMRPIAFEDSFDALTIEHALKPPADAGTPGSKAPAKFQMNWSLEP